MKHKLALIGFGTVGQGLCEILLEKADVLHRQYGLEAEVVAISDPQKGSITCQTGLELRQLLDLAGKGDSLETYRCPHPECSCARGWDALTTIHNTNADTVCELSYTNLETGEPALPHCRAALTTGKHVITSNKGPAALKYHELQTLARKHRVEFRIEGTVMSGTPVLNLLEGPLAGCRVTALRGILNGTTNYILTQMEAGMGYDAALKKAQDLGYAEADPRGDVEGHDAVAKLIILARVVMQISLSARDVTRRGITVLTPDEIDQARSRKARWKLVGTLTRTGRRVQASVQPEMIPLEHPLAGVGGATNALTITTDLLGDVTIVGPGAGRQATGFAILNDLLAIHRRSLPSNTNTGSK